MKFLAIPFFILISSTAVHAENGKCTSTEKPLIALVKCVNLDEESPIAVEVGPPTTTSSQLCIHISIGGDAGTIESRFDAGGMVSIPKKESDITFVTGGGKGFLKGAEASHEFAMPGELPQPMDCKYRQ